MDFRAAALIPHNPGLGAGWFAGIDGAGQLFIRSFETQHEAVPSGEQVLPEQVVLRLSGRQQDDQYRLTLSATDASDGRMLGETSIAVEPEHVVGNVALVSHPGGDQRAARWWFDDWRLSGGKVEADDSRTYGAKDWPMIARLVEANFFQNRDGPSAEQIVFWLRELRSGNLLIDVAQRFPVECQRERLHRELLALASAGDAPALEAALEVEQQREREADRIYWTPLKRELERLRRRGPAGE